MKKSLAVTLLTICLVIVPTLVAGFFCRLEALERTAHADSLSSQSGSSLSSEEEWSESVNDGVQSQADLPSEAEEQEWTDSQLYSTDYLTEEAALYDFVEYYMNLAFSELGEPQNADGWTKYGAYFGDGYAMWCTEFVIWCICQAEEAFASDYVGRYFPSYDSAYACVLWHEANGSLRLKEEYIPRRGDIIYFDYDFDGYGDHTGLVADIEYDEEEDVLYVLTIEGNLPEDIPNGVICERRLALDTDIILGYGTFDSDSSGEMGESQMAL